MVTVLADNARQLNDASSDVSRPAGNKEDSCSDPLWKDVIAIKANHWFVFLNSRMARPNRGD